MLVLNLTHNVEVLSYMLLLKINQITMEKNILEAQADFNRLSLRIKNYKTKIRIMASVFYLYKFLVETDIVQKYFNFCACILLVLRRYLND
jgi:hypothetical protein